jgi:hypothetical protein
MPGSVERGQGFVRQHELIEQLQGDVDKAYTLLEEDKSSQYLRRCVVRAVFSLIEALIECLKWELRSSVRTGRFQGRLTPTEQEVLGALHVIGQRSDKFLTLDQSVKKTFRLAAKIWDLPNFKLNTGGADFEDFLSAKVARNRLTHPKTVYDIEVTDLDMHCHTIAGIWLLAEFRRLFQFRTDALDQSIAAIKEKWDEHPNM